jgi:hypothetical protein
MIRIPVFLFLAALTSFSLEAAASQFKRIHDISVACTNGLSCDVSTYNAQSELYTVIFRRGPAADAPVQLVLGVRETLVAGTEVRFEIDGAEILRLPVSELSYRAAVYEYLFRGEDEIAKLMEAASAGRTLRVSFRARGFDTVSAFSLSGFVAGLIFMDEVQGRVGREDALHADGPERARDDVAIRDLVAFSDLPLKLRAEFTDKFSGACGGLEESRFADLGGFEALTSGEVWLIGLPCGSGGAYNQPYAFWERIGTDFKRVPLPVMTEEGPSTDDIAWNISWDQSAQELTGFFKGRGFGDCGVFNRWVWKEGASGNVFVLREARAKDECDGDATGGPENWPLVWP